MNESVRTKQLLESEVRNMEVVRPEEPSPPKNIDFSVQKKQALQARYIYGLIFLASNLFTWIVRDYGYEILQKIHYSQACRNEGDCFHAEGVLRVSFGCFIFFLVMFATTFNTCKLDGARNSWHSNWWCLKFLLWITAMTISILIPVSFIQTYGEIARCGAGLFLILQLISVIQFLKWCENYFLSESQSKLRYFFGIFLATLFYVTSFCGIISMYILYARGPACTLNIIFIILTVVLVNLMMFVSLHSKVNRGLLSSGIMASYVLFLCWSAIRSEPTLRKSSSENQISHDGDWVTMLSFLIAICAIVIATFSTGIDSKAFQCQRDHVNYADEVPYKYEFFHFIFSIGSMYFAMLFISWELDRPTGKWRMDIGWVSTWIKIINEWFAAFVYLWTLIYPTIKRNPNSHQEGPEENVNSA